jgi:4-cresol dehydrogenase (hydroxylating)
LRSAYWAKSFVPEQSLDPDRDRCGVLWACAALPWRGADVARVAAIVEPVMKGHGFDPMLAVVAPTERCAYAVPSILYDRDVAGADGRARATSPIGWAFTRWGGWRGGRTTRRRCSGG